MFHSSHYPQTSAREQIAHEWHSARLDLFHLVQKAASAVGDALLFLVGGLLFALSQLAMTLFLLIGISLALVVGTALLVLAASGSVVLIGAVLELLGIVR